jgi:LPS-assembly protein
MRRQKADEFRSGIHRKWMAMRKVRSRLHEIALSAVLTVLLALAFYAPSPAMAQSAGILDKLSTSDEGLPMLVQADEMLYDYENDKITAIGSVEIYYNLYVLLADKVVYDRNLDRMFAEGNVKLTQPDGNVIFANEFEVTGDFREGFIQSLSLVTPDQARVIASSAERVDGNIVVFNKAIYTACEIRRNDPDAKPLWQIRANRVVHNQEEQIIEFEQATFEFLGVPIAYFPYFFHADPTVKRKSGFLIPSISQSDDLGTDIALPYFWVIAPNMDATITPRYLSEQGFMLETELRHRVETGTYTIQAAGLRQQNPNQFAGTVGDRELRGMVRFQGDFQLSDQWTFGWDGTAISDDTFMNLYDLNSRAEITSEAFLTGIGERNYFDMRVMHFQDLALRGDRLMQPLVHPVIDYNLLFDDPVMQGQLSMNFNMVSLTRDRGVDSTRITTEAEWKRTLTDRRGQQFTPFLEARGDVYWVNNVVDPVTMLTRGNDTVSRGMVAAGLEYNYPFISVHEWGQQIIEPVAQVIFRPDERNVLDISNEDAVSLVFDDTTLFDTDKFSGFDRDEGGSRANVGLRYTVQTNNGGQGSLLVGQSFQLGGTNPFGVNSGLEDDSSDIVGALYVEPSSRFSMSSQWRLDPNSFQINRNEVRARANYAGASGSVTYMRVRNQTTDVIANREEIDGIVRLPITSEWAALGGYRYDIAGSQTIKRSIGLGYFCDCFQATFKYEEVFFRNQDITPDQRFIFSFYFKSLGGSSTGTDLFASN